MNDLKQIKVKAKVHPFDGKHKKYCRILEEYYDIARPKVINAIKIEIFHPKKNLKERQGAYEDYKKVILKLKPIFKRLVIERNATFKKKDCTNFVDFKLKADGVPEEKLKWFLSNTDKVIKNINQKLPLPKNLPHWYWSEFNIPDSLSFFRKTHKYIIPDDVYRLGQEAFPNIKEIIPRIKIEKKTGFNPIAIFIKETKSVIIKVPTKASLYNALTFIHELGHAIEFIKLADGRVDPLSRSRYWHEKQAYKFKFEFEELALPEKVKDASRGEVLRVFLAAFFEWAIHTNPDQDFDEAYAKAINRCYPGRANQKKNPFYVLENGYIFRPGSSVMPSITETELLLSNLSS